MNLGQFHSILATAREDIKDSDVPSHLQQLVSHLEQLSEDPAEPDHQRNVAQSRSALLEALEATPSNDYPPSWENTLQNYGLLYFLGKNVRDAVDDAFRGNDITPQAVFDALEAVQTELHKSLESTGQILTGFNHLGVETDILDEGDVEVSYTVPRHLYEESPSGLGQKFREIELLLKPFSEMATGHSQEFKVRSISSSDFMITLGLTNVAAWAAAKTVQAIAEATREIIGIYKDVMEIRLMKSKMREMEGAQDKRDTATEAIEDWARDKIDEGINEAADRIFAKFNKIKEEGRSNEMQNYIRANMKRIAAYIDHGHDIETRMGDLPPAITAEEEGDGEEASVESSETKTLREALETISEAHREQLIFEREGEPILSLPNPSDDEPQTT